jgi:hypothetical protein
MFQSPMPPSALNQLSNIQPLNKTKNFKITPNLPKVKYVIIYHQRYRKQSIYIKSFDIPNVDVNRWFQSFVHEINNQPGLSNYFSLVWARIMDVESGIIAATYHYGVGFNYIQY